MKKIRESKTSKIVAYYLLLTMFIQIVQPTQVYALTSGPTQPEFNAFTPIGTSDMVDLASGDFNYNIPIMDVGGYPINLAYNSGVTMDQEASWVGLGWNLNVGQISRQVRGLPDDFKGDEMIYENDLKQNRTVGVNLGVNGAFFGWDGITLGMGLGVQVNNLEGITFKPSFGVNFRLSENIQVGANFSSSLEDGASVTPSVGLSANYTNNSDTTTSLSSSTSLGFSSRKGIENLNVSASVSQKFHRTLTDKNGGKSSEIEKSDAKLGGIGGGITFNNLSFTPTKRVGYVTKNFTFNAGLGGEVFGGEAQGQLTGYGSYQRVRDDYKNRKEKGYGYENTQYMQGDDGVLDFNREDEKTISQLTTALPVTVYTYDLYNINGQGIGGMFRPFRSKVGAVYSNLVQDEGESDSFSAEVGLGNLVHGGGGYESAPSVSTTGPWRKNNTVLPYFKENNYDKNAIDYEPVSYKMVGSMIIDPEEEIYHDKIFEAKALSIGLGGSHKNAYTIPSYWGTDGFNQTLGEIKRKKRYIRSQLIQKITASEATNDPMISKNNNALGHHTAGIKVLKTDGSTYVYGQTAYNTKKVEATFDVSGRTGDNAKGLVSYTSDNGSIKGNDHARSDGFVNRITTPNYAHSYMITSVLSSDYEDVDQNGPSINDLGSFTKFEYKDPIPYKWRVPFEPNTATFNEGLFTNKYDQKANYLYGEKELIYLDKIVTKTHVAFFEYANRQDAISVSGETGGKGDKRMLRLKSIRLYSRPEITNAEGLIVDPGVNAVIKPIKTAHFEYDYSLCKGIPNNSKEADLDNEGKNINNSVNGFGKLTLKKVYFTYRNSFMGKYTPYVFTYNSNNPNYDSKGFDIWGNYKLNAGSGAVSDPNPNNTEFPYVEQDETKANANTAAWSLREIQLPSGGVITIETESDDYQYVQDRKAMRMFKVLGAGSKDNNLSDTDINSKILYNGNYHSKYLYVQLSEKGDNIIPSGTSNTKQWFIDNYLKDNYRKPIKFNFLLNMRDFKSQDYENVKGYFLVDYNSPINVKYDATNGTIVAIPIEFLNRDGGTNGNAKVNPIAKAGWGFGRSFLNRYVYGSNDDPTNADFLSIVNSLGDSFGMIKEIFTGPNKNLQDKGCARVFREKSWIRLEIPNGKKYGGGLRVKSVKLSDNWKNMLSNNGGTDLKNMEYGQTYHYDDGNGNSSGVATFEPNSSPENPFVEPMENKSGNYAQRIAAPAEINYNEKPFGENFYPSPVITYAKVVVKNLERKDETTGKVVKKHATGFIENNHYTSRDFPTKVTFTDLNVLDGITKNDLLSSIIKSSNVVVNNALTMSQGYSIVTNDMNGKIKSQTVYNELGKKISGVEYKYNLNEKGDLNNYFTTIDEKGKVSKKLLGLDYDMVNDFTENYSNSSTTGVNANLASFIIPTPIPFPIFIPMILPKNSSITNILRTAVTTKHIHQTGVVIETIASDLGAVVSTKNLAWDAASGAVLLTQTVNEYSDHYYSFTYPAYWMYKGMSNASQNIGIEGKLVANTAAAAPTSSSDPAEDPYFKIEGFTGDIRTIFHQGDELMTSIGKLWIADFKKDNSSVLLINKEGKYINVCKDNDKIENFKIVRSGYRNLHEASMASITSMINPLKDTNNDNVYDLLDLNSYNYTFSPSDVLNPRVINASAVAYNDFWSIQEEANFPYYPLYDPKLIKTKTLSNGEVIVLENKNIITAEGNLIYPYNYLVNPFLWNIKGDWRAVESYAYLTGRNTSNNDVNNPRNEGFFQNFSPFYKMDANKVWQIHKENWTYASSITKYSPMGVELENKDALDRYSAAQYGYNYTLPIAVASNAKYDQIGFEGFEESKDRTNRHFGFNIKKEQISTNESHTGKSSINVKKGNSGIVRMTANLATSVKAIDKVLCPTKGPDPTNYDCTKAFLQRRDIPYGNFNGLPDEPSGCYSGIPPINAPSTTVDMYYLNNNDPWEIESTTSNMLPQFYKVTRAYNRLFCEVNLSAVNGLSNVSIIINDTTNNLKVQLTFHFRTSIRLNENGEYCDFKARWECKVIGGNSDGNE